MSSTQSPGFPLTLALSLGERGRESKDECSCGCRMANELLILPLHLIQSALGQKVEAKPMGRSCREQSQSRAVMRGFEVACLPGLVGLPLSGSQKRATPSLAKFGLSAYFETGRAAVHAVSGALVTSVVQAITSNDRNGHQTDEVPRCPWPSAVRVSPAYKSKTKGSTDASETGTASPRPRPWGCRQRQSSRRHLGGVGERQNLRVLRGLGRTMGSVSPVLRVAKWPDGTSSHQSIGMLRNRLAQPHGYPWRLVDGRRNHHGIVS